MMYKITSNNSCWPAHWSFQSYTSFFLVLNIRSQYVFSFDNIVNSNCIHLLSSKCHSDCWWSDLSMDRCQQGTLVKHWSKYSISTSSFAYWNKLPIRFISYINRCSRFEWMSMAQYKYIKFPYHALGNCLYSFCFKEMHCTHYRTIFPSFHKPAWLL